MRLCATGFDHVRQLRSSLVMKDCSGTARWRPYTEPIVARTRTERLGPAARPVVVPTSFGDSSVPKAAGEVELPFHIRWSGPGITYDLSDRADRARVYEQVLREGTERDISYYVDEEELRELFDELVLPPAVRQEWADWLRRRA